MKPFSIHNAWNQLNVVRDPVLRSQDNELPTGIHPDRLVVITQLRNAWGAPKGSPELKAKIKAAYEANDREAAKQHWGELITSIYPVLREPPKPAAGGFSLRGR